jgi:DNA-binding transcriptional MerR regulator
MAEIPNKLYFKIGEVARLTKVKPYILRYWESEFNIISPIKSRGNHRVYKRRDIELILYIKKLLYSEKYSLEGAKKKVSGYRRLARQSQLSFPFTDRQYRSALKDIKKDLASIRDLLK